MKATATAILLVTLTIFNDLRTAYGLGFAYYGKEGPDHWGERDDSSCNGKHQSPININLIDVVDKQLKRLVVRGFEEEPLSGELENNGHTVVVHLKFKQSAPLITGGPFSTTRFIFSQFHFHWGENNTVGSEDRINNAAYPGELHMVFYNARYKSFEEAVTRDDGVAVMAYFFQVQEADNPNYAKLTELLADIRKPDTLQSLVQPPALSQLVTHEFTNYFTYVGSLTTPPCSENVIWVDFATPIMISYDQLERFRHLETYDGRSLAHNLRPTQPLNDRTVYKAVPMTSNDESEQEAIPLLDVGDSAAGMRSERAMLSALLAFILGTLL